MKTKPHPWVSLESFEVDPSIQPRPFLSRDAVMRYAMVYRSGAEAMPPIKVGRLPDGRTVLVDGFHRLEAAKQVGLTQLRAETVPTTREVLPWLAVEANIRNGVPIPRSQKREVFRRFIVAGQNRDPRGDPMSSRALARAFPIATHTAILGWIKSDFPKLYNEMTGRDEEEDLGELGDPADRLHDQAMANISWAEGQLVTAISKARKHVEDAEIADLVRSALAGFEAALGRPLITVDETLDIIHGREPVLDF